MFKRTFSFLTTLFLVTLFGLLSLLRLPVQMTPNVERPQIIVQTNWRSAAPEEIEAESLEYSDLEKAAAVGELMAEDGLSFEDAAELVKEAALAGK